MSEPIKIPVLLTAYEWHLVLKILEHELNTINASNFTGIPNKNVEMTFEHIADQLANPQKDAA